MRIVHTAVIMRQRNYFVGITFRTIFFFQLMNAKNIDNQSNSTLRDLNRQAIMNRMLSPVSVYTNIVMVDL